MVAVEMMTPEMKLCVDAWEKCRKACTETANYCLQKGGEYKNVNMLCMLRDCAEICLMCANLAADGSEFMGRTSELCAEMCDRCAFFCQQRTGDRQIQAFIEICRQCARLSASIGRKATSYYQRPNFLSEDALVLNA